MIPGWYTCLDRIHILFTRKRAIVSYRLKREQHALNAVLMDGRRPRNIIKQHRGQRKACSEYLWTGKNRNEVVV